MRYKFSRDLIILNNPQKGLRILTNSLTGKNVKITDQCYSIIKIMVDSGLSQLELLKSLADDDDREYFEALIDILAKNDILIDRDYQEEYHVESVLVELTHRCNLHCNHCSMSAGTLNDSEKLDTNEMINVLDNVISLNPLSIALSGGEPLVRSDFWILAEYLKDNSNSRLTLMTNGTLIDDKTAVRINDTFSQIDISIDGINNETYKEMRGSDCFNRVLNSVELLKKHGNIPISLSMVDTEITHSYIEKFKELCKKLDVFSVIRSLDLSGRALSNRNRLEIKEKSKWDRDFRLKQIEKLKHMNKSQWIGKGFSCGAGRTKFSVDYYGDLYPCTPLENNRFKLLSLVEKLDLKSVDLDFHDTSGFKELLSLMPYNICSECGYNMFCWECLHDVYLAKQDSKFFRERCELKKIEFEHIWE